MCLGLDDDDDDDEDYESGDSELAQSHGVEGQSISLHSSGSHGNANKKGSISAANAMKASAGASASASGRGTGGEFAPSTGAKHNTASNSKHGAPPAYGVTAAGKSTSAGAPVASKPKSSRDIHTHDQDEDYANDDDNDDDENFEDFMESNGRRGSLEKPKLSSTLNITSKGKEDIKSAPAPAPAPAKPSIRGAGGSAEEGLDDAERERRRSLELIMQRWSMPNLDADTITGASSSTNVSPATVTEAVAPVTSSAPTGAPSSALSAGIATLRETENDRVVDQQPTAMNDVGAARALIEEDEDDDDVRYAESFEDASIANNNETTLEHDKQEFTVTGGNTSANDEVY